MKVSVSLPAEDVKFLDAHALSALSQSFPSRSAVLPKAVRLLRQGELGRAYAAPMRMPSGSGKSPRITPPGKWPQVTILA
jgi:Arc/MetJ-type ribon-helix-helix transcriptional regulator